MRRGVFHNAHRLPDGSWTWRYDTWRKVGDFAELWAAVSAITAPAAEYARRSPGRGVHVVPGSGHSVQSDQPRALVELLRALP